MTRFPIVPKWVRWPAAVAIIFALAMLTQLGEEGEQLYAFAVTLFAATLVLIGAGRREPLTVMFGVVLGLLGLAAVTGMHALVYVAVASAALTFVIVMTRVRRARRRQRGSQLDVC